MSVEINRGNNNCIPISGIAYVTIPEDCDVAEYVQRCYRNNTLSVDGGMGVTAMHNVKVADGVLDKIKFPSDDSNRGSAVVWIRDGFYNQPVIIGAIPEGGKSNLSLNGQQRLYQEVAQRIAEVFLDALNSRVLITALGDLSKPSEIIVKASSRNDNGDVVNIISKDLVKVEGQSYRMNLTKDFELTIDNGVGNPIIRIVFNEDKLSVSDHYGNNIIFDEEKCEFVDQWENKIVSKEDEVRFSYIKDDEVINEVVFNDERTQVLCKKFDIGDGNEKMVLGDTLVNLLGELIDAICALTVTTSTGPSGTPINSVSFTTIKSKLNTVLSKLSNTD